MCGVVQGESSHSIRNGLERVIVTRLTRVVDCGYDFGAVAHDSVYREGVEKRRLLVDIGEDDLSAQEGGSCRGCDECHRGRDDFVAWANAGGCISHVQGCSSRRARDGGVTARKSAELLLELRYVGACGEPVASHHLRDGGDVLLQDRLTSIGQQLRGPSR